MHSAQELLTRWPAFDIAAKRARLQNSSVVSPGPVAGALKEAIGAAGRAAAGLWRDHPSVWSADEAVQNEIANRPGWMRSPALMADSIAIPRSG